MLLNFSGGNAAMIKFDNVTFSYGKKEVLKDFNLSIKDGERICMFAPSGYGKTTVLRLIMGLEKPKSGKIFGIDNKKIAVTFQEDRLIPNKTVKENIVLFGGEKDAEDLLVNLNLKESANNYPRSLSGGMARRVAIARALNSKGDIYIFDEPFNGIDKENIEKTAHLINEKTKNKTFILVTHKRDEAALLNCNIVEI